MLKWLRRVWAEHQRIKSLPPKEIRVLTVLWAEGDPVHSWEIIERAELWLGFLAIGHTTLREMECAGLVCHETRPDVLGIRGGRPSYHYFITDKGREYLDEWRGKAA